MKRYQVYQASEPEPRPMRKQRQGKRGTSDSNTVVVYTEPEVRKRLSSTAMLLDEFEKEIKKKEKLNRQLHDKCATKTKERYKRASRRQMDCPLCNMRLDSNNNLVEM